MPPPDTFATRLAALQLQAGLSISRLAEKTGLSRQAIHKLLDGERQPTWDTVQRLADALGVSTEALRHARQDP